MKPRQADALARQRAAQQAAADKRRAERLEDLAWMVETGETVEGAARRLGLTPNALDKWCGQNAPDLLQRLRSREVLPRDAHGRLAS